jgi:acyl-[acyl-carrier-protein]-phospholipid O-acyltransferase/long-chain-fatty-acid--[acyl-carrier-protein] ligase
LTSEKFLKKVKLEVPGQSVYLDEVLEGVSRADRLLGTVWACVFPVRLIERLLGAKGGRSDEDLATVIFSSGSEGDPKGVMLTHRNIASQAEAIMQVFPHSPKDGIMGMLPFFHSFGFTATIWLPLLNGMKAVYHPNPLDPRAIGGLIHQHGLTFFIATSTLLQTFIRRCEPGQLSTLKYIICGAERLSPQISEAFRQKFDVEPIEAYGATECAPGITMNIPNCRMRGFFQRGTKPGTVGHTLPGLTVVTTDLDTGEVLSDGQEGMLLVKGPNIMKGYLGQPEKTAAVLDDGWYRTGDIATIDEDGFVTIQGRLTRFSKIAGEMVPHGKVEETLHKVLDLQEQALAVLGVPDEKKGERLVVLHTLSESQLEDLKKNMRQSGLPNLWLPNADSFYEIDELPVLGSGKTDLRSLNAMAKDLSTAT